MPKIANNRRSTAGERARDDALNPHLMRVKLGVSHWSKPRKFGPDGWLFLHQIDRGSVIVSRAEFDGETWVHASIAWHDRMPTYDELQHLHRCVFYGGWAYQVFAPLADHVNIHSHALHLWGRDDGTNVLPRFAQGGSI